MTPLELVVSRLEAHGCRGRGSSWQCPAHEDQHESLSIGGGKDGGAVVKCHAGCATADVVKALRLEVKDLFPEAEKPASKRKPRIVATYPYVDEANQLLKEKLRTQPKGFVQRRPDPAAKDGWSYKLDGVRKVLYRLPGVLAAAQAGQLVYITEGEKAADAVAKLGLSPTCGSDGAGKWAPGYTESLRGAHVVILPDADEPGRKHGELVAKSLHGIAASVKVVLLPGLPEKGDAFDWIAAGGTRESLEALVGETTEWSPVTVRPLAELLEDLVNHIKRFVVLTGEQATLCALWVVHTYAVEAADVTPYLIVTSPERRCGKSRLLEVLRGLVLRAWYVVRPSEAVLFRKLAIGFVLFLDEYDTIFSTAAKDSTEGIRATLNAGFERGAVVSRCEDHGKELMDFEVFGPKVLGGIGDPPDTVRDRGFVISLRRARRTEPRERFRRRKAGPVAEEIRRRIEAWAETPGTIATLKRAEPALPDALNDRAQDAAEALLAIADLAAGPWPERARTALCALAGEAAEDEVEDTSGVALLRDLVTVFESAVFMFAKGATTEALIRELHGLEGTPWKKWNKGEGLDPNGLARLLKRFRIHSTKKRWRSGDEPRAGYHKADVLDAAERYVPPTPKDADEDEEAHPVPYPEHPERRNKPAQEAAPDRSGGVGTPPGTPPKPDAPDPAHAEATVAPFRPPFRPHPERLDPHGCAPRSGVPTVPGTPRDLTFDEDGIPRKPWRRGTCPTVEDEEAPIPGSVVRCGRPLHPGSGACREHAGSFAPATTGPESDGVLPLGGAA